MAHFPDLGTKSQIASGPHVRAVGWLAAGQPFATGPVAEAFLARLRTLCEQWGDSVEALGWPFAMGPHECELCGAFLAAGNFGVPAGDVLYVAPEMIAHYVEAHRYLPPEEFVAAVLAAPGVGTEAYAAAVAPFVED